MSQGLMSMSHLILLPILEVELYYQHFIVSELRIGTVFLAKVIIQCLMVESEIAAMSVYSLSLNLPWGPLSALLGMCCWPLLTCGTPLGSALALFS